MTGRDDLNIVADAINGGQWGYNNLQWIGLTYYHKLNDYWHIAFETWNLHENGVPNLNKRDGEAHSRRWRHTVQSAIYPVQCPDGAALCPNATVWLACTARYSDLSFYLNYSPNKLNNFSLRTEWFDDPNGQRTGVPNAYLDARWLGSIGFRRRSRFVPKSPTIGRSTRLRSTAMPTREFLRARNYAIIAASDIIIHF